MRILVVEDEKSIQIVIRTYLESAGYEVRCISKGSETLAELALYQPDLLILDLMLPGMDGMEVAARIREQSDVYILMVTARTEEADRVAGLRIGADDYLTKPFSPRELVARVEAILRRSRHQIPVQERLTFAHVRILPEQVEAWVMQGLSEKEGDGEDGHGGGETLLELTTTEFNLLLALARHAGRVLTREQIIERVWGDDFYGTDRIVDVFIGQIRRQLERLTGQNLIQTVRGVGYKFVDREIKP